MVERWTLPFDFGGSEMTPAPGGEFVSYADYEAAERKVAELEAERDNAIAMLETQAKLHRRAKAREARLSEALRNVRADCQSPIDLYHRVGPSFTSPGGDEYEPASYVMDKMQELITRIDAALSGSGSGWRAMDTAPETGFFLAWSPDFPDMVSCWKAEIFHQARKPGTPRHLSANHFTLWRPLDLPADPQQGGE